jgi:tetratricopeptide (TPR) repeat protein
MMSWNDYIIAIADKKLAIDGLSLDGDNLTTAELEVLLASFPERGVFNNDSKEVSEKLYKSPGTVNNQLQDIYSKILLKPVEDPRKNKNKNFRILYDVLNKGYAVLMASRTPVLDEWIGREDELLSIDKIIKSNSSKSILLYGKAGVGKTTLAEEIINRYASYSLFLEYRIGNSRDRNETLDSILSYWLRDKIKDDSFSAGTLDSKLAKLRKHLEKKPVFILIDNLETILDENGKILREYEDIIQLFNILNYARHSVALITSRENIIDYRITIGKRINIKGLSDENWLTYFNCIGIKNNETITKKICESYGGNAKAMKVVSASVRNDYECNLEYYWQENKDNILQGELKFLIGEQFDNLQARNRNAYLLICRLGIPRYQGTIPKINKETIFCLLWDVEEMNEKQQALEYIERCDLIEFSTGEYWLHPFIQSESEQRLNSELNLKLLESHQKLATFYLALNSSTFNHENSKHIRLAFEAFYHFYKSQSFSDCNNTLLFTILGAEESNFINLRSSTSIWHYTSQILQLATSISDRLEGIQKVLNLVPIGVCYSDMGENNKALETAKRILLLINDVKKIDEDETIVFAETMAYSIMGRAHRLIGNFQTALKYCELAEKVAKISSQNELRAIAQYELGRAYLDIKKHKEAFILFVLAAFQAIGGKFSENIPNIARMLSQVDKYPDYLERAVKEIQALILHSAPSDVNTSGKNIKKLKSIKMFRIVYSIAQCANISPNPFNYLTEKLVKIALSIVKDTDKSSLTLAYLELAEFYKKGREEDAEKYYLKANENLVDEDEIFVVVTVHEKTAIYYHHKGDLDMAFTKYDELDKELEQTDFIYLKTCTSYSLGLIKYDWGDYQGAVAECNKALSYISNLDRDEHNNLIDRISSLLDRSIESWTNI